MLRAEREEFFLCRPTPIYDIPWGRPTDGVTDGQTEPLMAIAIANSVVSITTRNNYIFEVQKLTVLEMKGDWER